MSAAAEDDDDWGDGDADGPPGHGAPETREVRIARGSAVHGRAATFAFTRLGEPFTGFVVIGADGAPRAWVNRCPHVPYPLDFGDGEVLDHDGSTIVCANHGARFDPSSGRCVWGPARGRALERLPLVEDGDEWVITITPEPLGWPRVDDYSGG